jgi:GPH family glycoside/pentoside/hexuronide:cation symporter
VLQDLKFPAWMYAILFSPKEYLMLFRFNMGFITDNTKSKWGQNQYVFIGALIMGISFLFDGKLNDGVYYNFIYFLVWSLIFYLGLTIFSVPYDCSGIGNFKKN